MMAVMLETLYGTWCRTVTSYMHVLVKLSMMVNFKYVRFKLLAALRQNLSSGFPTRSDTNRAVQPQGLYYPCRENKCADQLRGYRAADLRLWFRVYKTQVFFMTRLILFRELSSKVRGVFE